LYRDDHLTEEVDELIGITIPKLKDSLMEIDSEVKESQKMLELKFDSSNKEIHSYLQNLHKDLSLFVTKRKEEKKQWLCDIEKNRKDLESLSRLFWNQEKSMDELALIVACLVERASLQDHMDSAMR